MKVVPLRLQLGTDLLLRETLGSLGLNRASSSHMAEFRSAT